MSYWQHGNPVSHIETLAGVPTCFTWEGQVHPVKTVAKVWRVDDAWWLLRVWKDYFKLITTTGLLIILAHDLLTDEWSVVRIYD